MNYSFTLNSGHKFTINANPSEILYCVIGRLSSREPIHFKNKRLRLCLVAGRQAQPFLSLKDNDITPNNCPLLILETIKDNTRNKNISKSTYNTSSTFDDYPNPNNSFSFSFKKNNTGLIPKNIINFNIHEHGLIKTLRRNWVCDMCKSEFTATMSNYCRLCDFDVCESCYNLSKTGKYLNVHQHLLKYYFQKNFDCDVCKTSYKKGATFVCDDCYFYCCRRCFEKINLDTNIYEHDHELIYTYRKAWTCDVCKDSYRGECSYCCIDCDFDCCENCLRKEKGLPPIKKLSLINSLKLLVLLDVMDKLNIN